MVRARAHFDRVFQALTRPSSDRVGWTIWAILLVVVAVMSWLRPGQRSVVHIYEDGTARLLAAQPLYDVEVFNWFVYPPGFAAAFCPFAALPDGPGEAAWRVFIVAVLASGVWRACRLISPPPGQPVFMLVTLLLLPASVSAVRNGQVNVALSGAFLHAAVEFAAARWRWCGVWLGAAAALKPIAAVPLLLAGAVRPRALPPAAITGLVVCALPLLLSSWGYVIEQYRVFADIMLRRGGDVMAVPSLNTAELRGAAQRLGIEAPPLAWTAIRVGLALVALLAWRFIAVRREPPADRAVWLAAIAATYLMLCNPANETNSYVILTPVMALWAVLHWQRPASRSAGLAASLLCVGYLAPSLGMYRLLHLWWYVLLAIGFAVVMGVEMRRRTVMPRSVRGRIMALPSGKVEGCPRPATTPAGSVAERLITCCSGSPPSNSACSSTSRPAFRPSTGSTSPPTSSSC